MCQRAEKQALLLGDPTASGMVFRRLTSSSHFKLGQKCFLSTTERAPAEGRGQWVSGEGIHAEDWALPPSSSSPGHVLLQKE